MFHTFPEDIATLFEHQWVFFNQKDMWQERWKITKQATRLPNHIIAKKVIARTQVDTTMCNCCRRRLPSPSVSCVSSSGREFCVKSLVTSRFLQPSASLLWAKCLVYSRKLSSINVNKVITHSFMPFVSKDIVFWFNAAFGYSIILRHLLPQNF